MFLCKFQQMQYNTMLPNTNTMLRHRFYHTLWIQAVQSMLQYTTNIALNKIQLQRKYSASMLPMRYNAMHPIE